MGIEAPTLDFMNLMPYTTLMSVARKLQDGKFCHNLKTLDRIDLPGGQTFESIQLLEGPTFK